MAQTMQALKTVVVGKLGIAGEGGFLLELGGTRMLVGLGVNIFSAKKALHRAVITTGMTGLVAGAKGFVNRAFDPIGLPADGVDHWMAVASQLGVVFFIALDQLEGFERGVFR